MIAAFVSGNVGQDARVGMAGETPVVNFSVASRRYDHKEKKEVTDWVSCSLFGQRAEKLAQYLTKGSRVAVRGTLTVRVYVHNNEWRPEMMLRADDIELLGSAEKSEQRPASRPQQVEDLPF